jgi:hypothetical protein
MIKKFPFQSTVLRHIISERNQRALANQLVKTTHWESTAAAHSRDLPVLTFAEHDVDCDSYHFNNLAQLAACSK